MLGRWLRPAALAALAGLGALSPALAQEPANPATYSLKYPVKVPGDPSAPDQPQRRHGCWATHFGFSCGTFRSNMVFIFGSCRAFYGEACKTSAPPEYAAGYQQPGNGTPAGKGCGCQ
jgi:hypothetical protein